LFSSLTMRTYAGCNLVEIGSLFALDADRYVYDATTHELVGIAHRTDTDRYTCGSSRVAGMRAGVMPESQCDGGTPMTTNLCPQPDAAEAADAADAASPDDGNPDVARAEGGD